jgi:hypothetical protein
MALGAHDLSAAGLAEAFSCGFMGFEFIFFLLFSWHSTWLLFD